MGAIRSNGNLYCPATPKALLELGPLARGATDAQTATHDRQAAELARYKLPPITGHDRDGYHRVAAPRHPAKAPLPAQAGIDRRSRNTRPEVLSPPEHPPTCCSQKPITVPPYVNAKTAQKHDYPSAAHRRSYARRWLPSAPTPPSRTPPPTTSPAAGAG